MEILPFSILTKSISLNSPKTIQNDNLQSHIIKFAIMLIGHCRSLMHD